MTGVLSEWKAFINGLPVNHLMRPVILASWERSHEAGVDPYHAELHCIADTDLQPRLLAHQELLDLAKPHLEWVSAFLSQVPHVVYLADSDGIILWSIGNRQQLGTLGLLPGFDWSESRMGTNGAGTAIRANQPVAVVGPEHYSAAFHDCTCTAAPLHDPEGRVIGAVDISTSVADGSPERVALAAHIAYVIDQQIAFRHLQVSEQRKDEFLAMLVHELRSPLAPIRSAADALAMTSADQELIQLIQNQVQQSARLIEDLTQISRISRGKLELHRQITDFNEVVRQSIDVAYPLIQDKQQVFHYDEPTETIAVRADPVRLNEIVTNLLTNASKYTPNEGEIRLTVTRRDGWVELQVRDNGIGIQPEVLPQIFDLFAQSERGLSESQGGLGIGLALVKSLVQMHGGSVIARSDGANQGSEFTVRLPALEDVEIDEVVEPIPTINSTVRRILIVDDSKPTAKAMHILLSKLGHEVYLAHDGQSALAAAQQHRPDLIFLDLNLPDWNGDEVAKRLRAIPDFQRITIAALSGQNPPAPSDPAGEDFDHYFVKPISMEALTPLLAEAPESQNGSGPPSPAPESVVSTKPPPPDAGQKNLRHEIRNEINAFHMGLQILDSELPQEGEVKEWILHLHECKDRLLQLLDQQEEQAESNA